MAKTDNIFEGSLCEYTAKPVGNGAEAKFITEALDAGYKVYRRGWPDFLIVKGDKIYAVEVKRWGQEQTEVQSEVMSLLSKVGLKCLLWKPRLGFIKFSKEDIKD